MKRPSPSKRPELLHGDIERDLTPKQLAKIGAISFAYNNAEDKITALFGAVMDVPQEMVLEIVTRTGGMDGRIAIILAGAKRLELPESVQHTIEDTLGEAGFQRLKKCREAVIHARLISSPHAIGVTVERRAKRNEVLLSQAALDALYQHLTAIYGELNDMWTVLMLAFMMKSPHYTSDGLKKTLSERELPNAIAQYLQSHKNRQTLPPIPEFPPEPESDVLANQWLADRAAELMAEVPIFAELNLKLPDPPYTSVDAIRLDLFRQAIERLEEQSAARRC
jgi:hypothetical protein